MTIFSCFEIRETKVILPSNPCHPRYPHRELQIEGVVCVKEKSQSKEARAKQSQHSSGVQRGGRREAEELDFLNESFTRPDSVAPSPGDGFA